ncbi:MAG: NAD(P)-dependent oxidoreductase [Candidatus Omnitrophota bacterium]
MKPIIAVTEKEFYKAREVFAAFKDFTCTPAEPDEFFLSEAIRENRAFAAVVGLEAYRNRLYESLPRGGVIARFGVGHDGIDKTQSTKNGILVTNTPGVLDNSVAEHAVLLMGSFAHNIGRSHYEMKQKLWNPVIGSELYGKALLVIGCGSIGCKVARIASAGFSMRVSGYDTASLDAARVKKDFGVCKIHQKLDHALAEADFISLHIPCTLATRHFVNRAFLSALKPQCVIINTSRGQVIDEEALYDVLKAGRIAGAAIDVFENEPFIPVSPGKDLRKLENILMTPHISSSTKEACCNMALTCLVNIKAAAEKRYGDMALLNRDVLKSLPGG